MMAGLKMVEPVAGHGALVIGEQDSPGLLGPDQDLRIGRLKRKVGTIAHAQRVDRMSTALIMSLDGGPQGTAHFHPVQKQ
jgi:hypothetical protein